MWFLMLGVMANAENPASHKYSVETGNKMLGVSFPQIGFPFFTLIQSAFSESVWSWKLQCRVLF
jgi:hypothetical protein